VYEMYSKYYDRLNDRYSFWTSFIERRAGTPKPGASVIEYGCGTGNVLMSYKDTCRVTGVDLSPEMLARAKDKMPLGEFHLCNMIHYTDSRTYDLSLCLFDSINHVLDTKEWRTLFANVSGSLSPDGTFVMDVNTTARLERMAKRPPFMNEFDGNYFFMKLRHKSERSFVFDVRILQRIGEGLYREEREEIEETTQDGNWILGALRDCFGDVKAYNEGDQEIPIAQMAENEESRLFFVCRNRPISA
jgi:SAM-dependent methyltransferase